MRTALATDRIIVALDTADPDVAQALVEALGEVHFWKVGLELFTAAGPSCVRSLKEQGGRVFLDLKFHDIPNTVAGACRSAVGLGVDFLTVHAGGGAAMIRSAVGATQAMAEQLCQPAPKILAVTLLTSIGLEGLQAEMQVPSTPGDYVLKLAEMAVKSGADGLVCSGGEVGILRDLLGSQVLLVTPGIRPHGTSAQDQQRVFSPVEALRAGADYLVVGRPVTAAPDPAAAYRAIVAEISEVVR